MHKLLLDTNCLLDIAIDHRPYADEAARLFDLIAKGGAAGIVSPTSLKDFYYITRKDMDERTRRAWLQLFIDAFAVSSVGRDQCVEALASEEPDFEDGIILAVATIEQCDGIVSRDASARIGAAVQRLDTKEAVTLVEQQPR